MAAVSVRRTSERFLRRMTRLSNAFSIEHFPHCPCKNFKIKRERLMLDIPQVMLELLFPRQCIASVDLRPPGDTWKNIMPVSLFRTVPIEIFHHQRPWADQTHVAFQHIEKAREFIQTRIAQESAKSGDTLALGKQTTIFISLIGHRSEFINGKDPCVQTGTLLGEEDGRAEVHTHEPGKTGHQW